MCLAQKAYHFAAWSKQEKVGVWNAPLEPDRLK